MSGRNYSGWSPVVDARIPSSCVSSSYNESWEERAFAQDSADPIAGCVWPPRSYSCSFCRREFRSAQALGGHMNVHRRDRARLREPSSPAKDQTEEDNQSCTSFGAKKYQSQVGSHVKPNPNSIIVPPTLSPRLSAPSNREDWDNSLFSPSITDKETMFSSVKSLEDSQSMKLLFLPELRLDEQSLSLKQTGYKRYSDRSEDIEDDIQRNKRRVISIPPCFIRRCLLEEKHREVFRAKPDEELDLELRLGNVSKGK